MASLKSETLTVRIAPEFKERLRDLAKQEHRSLANMIEVMIRDFGEDSQSASRCVKAP
jgi:predicted transcriptional regulator